MMIYRSRKKPILELMNMGIGLFLSLKWITDSVKLHLCANKTAKIIEYGEAFDEIVIKSSSIINQSVA